jgi:hypothetical protein
MIRNQYWKLNLKRKDGKNVFPLFSERKLLNLKQLLKHLLSMKILLFHLGAVVVPKVRDSHLMVMEKRKVIAYQKK